MTSSNCKYYDEENGWCKYFSDWSDYMPHIAYCVKGPCPHYQSKGNKIEIDAKYNIGDEVWFTDYIYDTYYPCEYPGTIYEIEIEVTEKQRIIHYWVRVDYGENKGCEKYTEEMCFASYEECEQWCDEHNK